jgi:DNA-directed RNA polymerase specialized sigma24 family protein
MGRAWDEEFDWMPVMGRALAYLCLDAADMGSRPVLERAEFLMKLGLPRKEAALIVGSTDASVRVLQQRARRSGTKKRKGGGR